MSTNPWVKLSSFINKHWLLKACGHPVSLKSLKMYWLFVEEAKKSLASKTLFDSATIFHEPKDEFFRPIVFTGNTLKRGVVKSEGIYDAIDFYSTLINWLKMINDLNFYANDTLPVTGLAEWNLYLDNDHKICWGCREFTVGQLRHLKKTMEWHYKEDSELMKQIRMEIGIK